MQRSAALDLLKSIPKPLLVDGGYWQFGRVLYVLTDAGLITVDCRVYDPMLGPIEFSMQQYAEIKEIAKESESLEENDDLDPDEKLFLFNDGKPGVPYWAFQPHDDAALDDYVFSSHKTDIEQAFIEQALTGKVEPWEGMDEKKLIEWAERVEALGESGD
ncbi:MAG: hypothetical protein FJY09_08120 [Chlorobi bacterium]|nr:hypothetical protein [Chlorobiota bacterium]